MQTDVILEAGGPAGSGCRLARKTSRVGKVLGGLGALALAIAATGCAAPQFTYVADGSANTYFKVPYSWHKIDDSSLSTLFKSPGSVFGQQSGMWDVAYDGAALPTATDLVSPVATQPFAFAFVAPLTASGSNAMSYNTLRDATLPVTAPTRAAAAKHKFPLTNFHLLRDEVIQASQGIHGVRETFDYTYPNGIVDTFDQVALTNANATQIYVLEMHCMAACYSQNQQEFDTILSSFTVRSP